MSQETSSDAVAKETNSDVKEVLTSNTASTAAAEDSSTAKTQEQESTSTSSSIKIIHSGWLSKQPQSGPATLNSLRYQARYFILSDTFFGYATKRIPNISSEKDLAHSWKIADILYADVEGSDHIKIIINSSEAEKRTLILKGSVKSVEIWMNSLRNIGIQAIPPPTASDEANPPTSPKVERPKKSSFVKVLSSLSPGSTNANAAATATTATSTENNEAAAPATEAATTVPSDDAQKKSTIPNPLQKAANWFTSSLKIPGRSKPKEATPPVSPIPAADSERPVVDNAPVTLDTDPLNSTDQSAKIDADNIAITDKPADGANSTIPDWPMATPIEREVEEPRSSRCANFFSGIFSFCAKESD